MHKVEKQKFLKEETMFYVSTTHVDHWYQFVYIAKTKRGRVKQQAAVERVM